MVIYPRHTDGECSADATAPINPVHDRVTTLGYFGREFSYGKYQQQKKYNRFSWGRGDPAPSCGAHFPARLAIGLLQPGYGIDLCLDQNDNIPKSW
jgi:hypothetical protein